ncbi:MAG: DUF5681 domain-containing protein [Patescibacteria group bacterium]|nr:DUF5681 domain-containing protein [Patescibacteria group bacterium]
MANPNTLKPWKPGQSGNPAGRPKGSRNFETDFRLACRAVAEALRLGNNPQRVHIELIKRGIKEGLTGNYPFWRDLMDRLYEKNKTDLFGFKAQGDNIQVEFIKFQK